MHVSTTSPTDAIARAFETAASQAFHSIMITEAGPSGEGHKVVYVNPAFTAMTGFTPEEVIGKTPRMLQGDRTDQAVINELRDKLQNNSDFHGQTINYRKDGSEFPIEWKVSPIRDGHGKVTHHVAVQREVAA